ncbi:sensor domain-containing protein [Thalassotalea piscium]
MNDIVQPYLRKASLLAGIAILFGLILSVVVFISSNQVKLNAVDLVDQRIPVLISIKELMADLVEQERVIYEYYSDQNDEAFLAKTAQVKAAFAMHLGAIKESDAFSKQLTIINSKQEKIISLFTQFYQLMLIQDDNWDEMRAVLSEISTTRRSLLPTLMEIEKVTQEQVSQGHKSTLSQVNITHWLVGVFAVILLFVAAIVSWYIRQYILTQAKSMRLAMFTHANPNPILSINMAGEIVFSNPACEQLLQSVGMDVSNIDSLLPENFLELRQKMTASHSESLIIEQSFANKILEVNIYWHQSLKAYDIHIRDVTERKMAEQKVHKLAFTNQDTGIANQYQFRSDIEQLVADEEPFSLGIVEIRHFSDKLGSLGVDSALAIVSSMAQLITKCLPENVSIYHINQQQFAIVLLEKIGCLTLQKLTKEITDAGKKPLITPFGEFFVDLDFGYSCYPLHGETRSEIVKNAHTALAISTMFEHENFTLFDYSQAQALDKKHQLIGKLRNAIALDELFLVFQPQLNIKTGQVIGVETLVRWRHQDKIISPVDFIPLAEQSGLIVEIGQWILNQACLFAKRLVDLGYVDIVVAVNVSPRQFSHPQFCYNVNQALSASGLPPRNLELEITEGVFMHNEEHTIALLHELKSIGLSLSIDDFGTGYSSLSYLKQFPVDKLKIDQSFIRDSHTNDEDKAIVNTIVSLGKNLGLILIAEGVEEQIHVEFLTEIECDEIQGYWFSRPLETAPLIDFMSRHHGSSGSAESVTSA